MEVAMEIAYAPAPARTAFKQVLLATDLSSEAAVALYYATEIARRFGSSLFVTHVISPSETAFITPEYWGASQQVIEDAARRQLAEIDEKLQGLPHKILLERGRVADTICFDIDTTAIDLLILGTHGREGLGRITRGSVAEELIRRASCPVLTVGPHAPVPESGVSAFQQILFATNFGPKSLAGTEYAIAVAQEFQSQITVLNVMNEDDFDSPVDPQAALQVRMKRLGNLIRSDSGLAHKPECLLDFGKAADVILRLADDRRADLIVMGAKPVAHIGVTTHILSPTVHTVVSLAHSPVMTVC
jgi:nucleotide-binding universal stress UspA family protein